MCGRPLWATPQRASIPTASPPLVIKLSHLVSRDTPCDRDRTDCESNRSRSTCISASVCETISTQKNNEWLFRLHVCPSARCQCLLILWSYKFLKDIVYGFLIVDCFDNFNCCLRRRLQLCQSSIQCTYSLAISFVIFEKSCEKIKINYDGKRWRRIQAKKDMYNVRLRVLVVRVGCLVWLLPFAIT